jgi:phytoene desaturase
MKKKAIVIGSGFAGMSSAAYLAQAGYEVEVLEMHDGPGGRGRQWSHEGYTFDLGPSFYWMPDVFETFFGHFGKTSSDYYELRRLDPSYSIYFEDGPMPIPAQMSEIEVLFDRLEPGSAVRLRAFLKDAEYKYRVGIDDLVRKPSRSVLEFADVRILTGLLRMDLLRSIRSSIAKVVSHPKLRQLLEFPVLFLGATPSNTPALYSLMNYSDFAQGTWYPIGGMYSVVQGFYRLAQEQGVRFHFNQEVTGFAYEGKSISGVYVGKTLHAADIVVASADYAHVEQKLLKPEFRRYTANYWAKRKMAPSAFMYYLGLDTKLTGLEHHTLFFDADFDTHADAIYTNPRWPEKPLFYLSIASATDASAAPEGKDALVILIPMATGLEDDDATRQRYLDMVAERMKAQIGMDIREHIVIQRSFAYRDFVKEYHAHRGNAYGLANTLDQTAILKPSLKGKLNNLYYAGQLTVPGPGVPPCIISGEVVAREITKEHTLV